MKKKILIVGGLILLIASIPFAVLASKDLITYDEAGRVIVFAGQERPDIPEDTPTVLVVPKETDETINERKKKEREEALTEKRNFEEISTYTINEETDIVPFSEEEKNEMDNVINAKHNIEEDAIFVLKKYYDNQNIDDLFQQLKNDSSIVTSGNLKNDYVIPESGIKILRIIFEVLDQKKLNEEEEIILQNYLKTIDFNGIKEDMELKAKLENIL